MSKAIAVAKPSIESVGAESHQPSPHATKSRKQKLIDAPRQSNTSVKALANEAVTVNDHPTRPPRLILIVARQVAGAASQPQRATARRDGVCHSRRTKERRHRHCWPWPAAAWYVQPCRTRKITQ